MATIRSGSKPVLLVIDAQEGVLAATHDRDAVLENMREALGKARERGVPVVWIRHSDQDLVRGSDAWRLAAGLEALPGERRIDKHHNSSFENTGLDAALEEPGGQGRRAGVLGPGFLLVHSDGWHKACFPREGEYAPGRDDGLIARSPSRRLPALLPISCRRG